MITSFNTPVRELDGNIFVAVEELYKRDEIIEQLKKQLEEEKNAYNRMYNMYVEKDNIIKELEKFVKNCNEYNSKCNSTIYEARSYEDSVILYKIKELKGSDKE